MYFIGFVISGWINYYLKITFKQQRPERSKFFKLDSGIRLVGVPP